MMSRLFSKQFTSFWLKLALVRDLYRMRPILYEAATNCRTRNHRRGERPFAPTKRIFIQKLYESNQTDLPIYVVEVQFQENSDFYWCFFTEIFDAPTILLAMVRSCSGNVDNNSPVSMSHNLTVRSALPLANIFPLGEKATDQTRPSCPENYLKHSAAKCRASIKPRLLFPLKRAAATTIFRVTLPKVKFGNFGRSVA